ADSGSRERNGAAPVQLAINTTPAGASSADVGEAVRMAGRALKANLFRTVLTLLGIVIGVASLVAMLAVGNGARQSVVDRIRARGINRQAGGPGGPSRPRPADGVCASLTAGVAKAVGALPNVRAALGELQGSATLRSGNTDYKTQIIATNASM